jgi:isocitrate lyase
VRLQHEEFAREKDGYTATKHQREAGTGYFDQVLTTITGGEAATAALSGSTEAEQFHSDKVVNLRPADTASNPIKATA